MTSSFVLPWIGGPSRSSSPGRMRKLMTENSTTVVTSTKIGTEAMTRTSHSVSILSAWVESAGGLIAAFRRRRSRRFAGRAWQPRGLEPLAAALRRRGDPVVAPERLRELRRLAIADAVRHLADGEAAPGEHLRRTVHPHAGQV